MFDGKFALEAMGQIITKGLPVSALIVAATVLISMPLAFLLGLLRFKRVKGITQVSTVLISFFRGVPLVILIFILYSAMPDVLTKLGKLYGWGIDFYNINRIAYAVFICCLFTVAIMSEIFRSALAAVHANQLEAAHSVGLSTVEAYVHIIIPQALVSAIPNLGNNIINLFKGTALVFYMGVADIMGVAKSAAGINYNYLEAYVDVFLVYVVICFVMQKLFEHLERRLGVYNAR
ncbi:MAG: amino acid ABC transporter permease [Oscillospiraceae bacterium]|jgi:L-cystine transport system permease protein|nr:amino acid ABC transporter permease [Oscillospiraceae bacterium]MCI9587862.1 amino acid ABC transporter permease [Oscillospiraceae bacterium]